MSNKKFKNTNNVSSVPNRNVTNTSSRNIDRSNTTRYESHTSERVEDENNSKVTRSNKSKKKKFDVRSFVMLLCMVVAVGSFGYIYFYNYQAKHSTEQVDNLSKIKGNNESILHKKATVNLDEEDTPDILDEYVTLYELNKKLVGWIKIDGTKVDYPVLQTGNNDYYLDHNFDQEEDRNGSIFLDKECSIWPRSQNLILYGHNMRSGKMFGTLKSYKDESFYKKHPQLQFDTLYEKGTYDIMYVFSEVVHDETEVAFKYYQFISANSEVEYNSYMNDMAEMSLYDTGVTSTYGDALITLSTCDYSAGAERFVIVAKRTK